MMRRDVDGRIYASPYWRGGRYLYLVYPTGADGQRTREYIGADPKRTAEALRKVGNGKRYDALAAEVAAIERELLEAPYSLDIVAGRLERVAPVDLVTEAVRPGDW